MIKIYLPNQNYRFYKNIKILNEPNIHIIDGDAIDIYKTHNSLRADIYIFDSYIITNEITEFISEYYNSSIKFYIYHDSSHTLNKDAIKYLKTAKHLLHSTEYTQFSQYHNVINIPDNLINDQIFARNKQEKIDAMVYFLDKDSSIPEPIKTKLYPATKHKLFLFNNAHLKHPQNLGFLSEYEKADILNQVKYFIPNKYNDYIIEAISCGCDIMDINNMNIVTNNFSYMLSDKTRYIDFLKSYVL